MLRPILFSTAALLAATSSKIPTPAAPQPGQYPTTVEGEVYDPTGALMPGVRVTVTDNTTRNPTVSETDSTGRFKVALPPSGDVSIRFEREGFRPALYKRAYVSSGKLGVTLVPEEVFEFMEIRSALPQTSTRRNPVRVYGGLVPAERLSSAEPRYPDEAQQQGVGGVVILQAWIDARGEIGEAKVVRGHPLLCQAALEAVRQWRYHPALLNGEPWPSQLTVTLRFQAAKAN